MQFKRVDRHFSERGFTILELLVIVTILGILAAIAVPMFYRLLNTVQLNISNDQIYRAMRLARSNAVQNKNIWQVSFRQQSDRVQWAVHPAVPGQFMPPTVQWQSLMHVQLDVPNTTLDCSKKSCLNPENMWRVQFNYHGHTNGQLGRVTLVSQPGSSTKRCVIVSTLIGTLRTGREQAKPDSSNRLCY